MPRDPDFVAICDAAKAEVSEITWSAYEAQLQSEAPLLLIDVREESEWAKGSIPGAIHIGKGVIERDIAKHVDSKTQPMVLYCGGGSRSALAALNLQKMGYRAVSSLIGGYRGYANADMAKNNAP